MIKSVLTAILIVQISVSAFSQSVSEIRQIKTSALGIFEKYEGIMMNLYNGDVYNEDKFFDLFESNATLYNDILPANHPQQVSPKEYFDKFVQNIKMNYAEYRNLNIEFPYSNEDQWEVKCTFNKDISFISKSENYYPNWTFSYSMIIAMDKNFNQRNQAYESIKIRSIEVANPLNEFIIIENPQKIEIKYNNKIIDVFEGDSNSKIFNEADVEHFEILVDKENLNYFTDLEKKWMQKQSGENIYYPEYKFIIKNKFELGFNYSPVNFGNKISSEKFEDIALKSNTLSLLFLYGKQINQKDKSTWFFNYGFNLNKNFYKYTGTNYREYQSIDSDNDPYLRRIYINSLKERINSYLVSIPLSMENVIQLSLNSKNPFFLVYEFGGFVEYALYSISNYSLNADYHGLYNYFGGVEFNHYYDYGNFDQSNIQKLTTIKDFRYDYGAFCKVGVCYAIDNYNVFKFNITYKLGFNTPLAYKESYVISESNKSYQTLLQSTDKGMQNLFFGISWIKAFNNKKSM